MANGEADKHTLCVISLDQVAVITHKGLLLSDGSYVDPSQCSYEEGSILRLYYSDEENVQHIHRNKRERKMSKPAPEDHTESTAQSAETSTQSAEIADLSSITDKPGMSDNPVLGIGLALIAVVGGGAGWKFYQKLSEQKHEQAMKKLEIDAANVGLNGAQPPPCQAATAKLEAEIAALRSDIQKNASDGSSFTAMSSSVDSLEQRLKVLEKAVKQDKSGKKR